MDISYSDILTRFFHTETITDYSLEKIKKACEFFGNPQENFKSIHIAGTNGKGSVSKMVFQILKDAQKKVGVYTSPHLIDIRERFETDEGLISETDFIRYATEVIQYDGGLSYYERCVLVAFLYFRDSGCEYTIIEVGMGGRLDATNIILPILSIITSISYDHMEFLGDTLEKIATEKGGIIKEQVPVILYERNHILETLANEKKSPIIYPKSIHINTNLIGKHQVKNAQIAYEAGVVLGIPESIILDSLLHVNHLGRLQYISKNLLIDGAHNEDGLQKLKNYLEGESRNWEKIIYSFNLKKGKQPSLVIEVFDYINDWYIITSSNILVDDPNTIASQIQQKGKIATTIIPSDIFIQAQNNPKNLFVVFGSLYMLQDFLMKN